MQARLVSLVILLSSLLFLAVPFSEAKWVENGVAICTAIGERRYFDMTSDGYGGAIITWQDWRDGVFNKDIYAQRISIQGSNLWDSDGISICTATNIQGSPKITSVGTGEAIIIWADKRSGNPDIYAQKIDSNGAAQWTTDGIAICTVSRSIYDKTLIPDGTGGAIVTWRDERIFGDFSVYAQRIDSNGVVQWTADGIPISTATNQQLDAQIVSDGSGGAIIVWADNRSGAYNYDIYAQRINASGVVQWATNGVPICTDSAWQSKPQLISSDDGGAFIVWMDQRSGYDSDDIYGQRIDSNGNVLWATDGIAISAAPGSQIYPRITTDGAGTAIIVWLDTRNGNYDIYAQRIYANGSGRWTADGVAICTSPGIQFFPEIISNDTGGAIITWDDQRDGNYDIYAQMIDSDGIAQWTTNGVAVCAAMLNQRYQLAALDGWGGAIFAWEDERNGKYDIYAQRIEQKGYWGHPEPIIRSIRDVPGDQGGFVNLAWYASTAEEYQQLITHYTLWRDVSGTQASQIANNGAIQPEIVPDPIPKTSRPIILEEQLGAKVFSWVLIDSLDAYHFEAYSRVLPTLFDTTATTTGYHYFQVVAHTDDPSVYWVSEPDSGCSADNLAPLQPQGLIGNQSSSLQGLVLLWNQNLEPDLLYYAVYRGLSEDFVPCPRNLITSTRETFFFDEEWRRYKQFYYKVSAIDIHDNESQYSLLSPENVSGDDANETPKVNYLAQNYPNPFYLSTSIVFAILKSTNVSLTIYDASGKLISVLVDSQLEADRYRVGWDGKDDKGRAVASGIYFYRFVAGAFSETRKMILIR